MEKLAWPEAINRIAGRWPAAGGGRRAAAKVKTKFQSGFDPRGYQVVPENAPRNGLGAPIASQELSGMCIGHYDGVNRGPRES